MFIKIHRVLKFARYIVRFNEPGPITAAPRPRPPCAAAPPLSGRSTPDIRYAGLMASADGPDATGTDAAGPDAGATEPGTSSRPALRIDAERNRQRLIAAAREIFAERGLDVPIEDIAPHARVRVA